jgi:hypothetical protein
MNKQTTPLANVSDLNQMVMGLTGRSGSTMNELIAALLLYKTTATELERQVNANTQIYAQAQGDAEKAFYDAQGTMDLQSGGLKIGEAGADAGMNLVGSSRAGSQKIGDGKSVNDAEAEQNEIIKECNDEEKKPKSVNQPGISKESVAGLAVGENNLNGPKNVLEEEKSIADRNTRRKSAQEELKTLSDRRSNTQLYYQRLGETAGAVFQSADKFQSSVEAKAQGDHKRAEISAQMANQINQNVQKGFDTQKDTASSDIGATISAYGAQGLGQANLHRPV